MRWMSKMKFLPLSFLQPTMAKASAHLPRTKATAHLMMLEIPHA